MSGILTKNSDRLPFANSGEKPIATAWSKYNASDGHVETLVNLLQSIGRDDGGTSKTEGWIGYILNYVNQRIIYYGHRDAVLNKLANEKTNPNFVELIVYTPTKYLASHR